MWKNVFGVFGLLLFVCLQACPDDRCTQRSDCAGASQSCVGGRCVVPEPTPEPRSEPQLEPAPEPAPERPGETDIDDAGGVPEPLPDPTTTITIGSLCQADADCPSGANCQDPGGLGATICTKSCLASSDCSNTFCDIHSGLKEGLCLPKCSTNDDCKAYAPLTLCTKDKHCWKPGELGALCQFPSDCKDPSATCLDPGGLGPTICTKSCTSDADCTAGTLCDTYPDVKVHHCLPKCSTSDDCKAFLHMDLCVQQRHCWRKGWFGALCKESGDCLDGLKCAASGSGPMFCQKECFSDVDCNVDGRSGRCADPGNTGTMICLPSCAGDTDCASFPHLATCNLGTCWR